MDTSDFTIGCVQNLVLELETRPLTEVFKSHIIILMIVTYQITYKNHSFSLVSGIRRVRADNYAFILPNTIADYISRRKPCDIQMVPVISSEMQWGYGLAVPKGSGLRDYLNSALLILEERGFLKGLYEKWWINRGSCAGIRSSRVVSSISNGSSHLRTVLLSVLTLSIVFAEYIVL